MRALVTETSSKPPTAIYNGLHLLDLPAFMFKLYVFGIVMIQMNYIYTPRSLRHLVLFDLIDVHTICKITCQILTISYQFRIFTSLLIQAVVIVESPVAEKSAAAQDLRSSVGCRCWRFEDATRDV